MEGKTARGASSPANPALHMPEIRQNIIYFKKPHYWSSFHTQKKNVQKYSASIIAIVFFFIFSGGYSICRDGNRIFKEDEASLLSLQLAPSPFPWLATFYHLPSLI
jgi:hypothetical protein